MLDRTASVKAAATRIGVDVAEYIRREAAGELWCSGCECWHIRDAFPIDRGTSRGFKSACLETERRRYMARRDERVGMQGRAA